jgi:hypothetical protein
MTTLRQLLAAEKKFLELHEAIRENDGVECETLPDFFFPEEPDREAQEMVIKVAKQICEGCLLKAQCLDYANSTRVYGIWGGTTYSERYSSE